MPFKRVQPCKRKSLLNQSVRRGKVQNTFFPNPFLVAAPFLSISRIGWMGNYFIFSIYVLPQMIYCLIHQMQHPIAILNLRSLNIFHTYFQANLCLIIKIDKKMQICRKIYIKVRSAIESSVVRRKK